jgi:hypothetical protein
MLWPLDCHQYLHGCAGDYVSIDKYYPHMMGLVEYYLSPILPEGGNRPFLQNRVFLECHILIGYLVMLALSAIFIISDIEVHKTTV